MLYCLPFIAEVMGSGDLTENGYVMGGCGGQLEVTLLDTSGQTG